MKTVGGEHKTKKFVIVLCELDSNGKIIPKYPPYGYHHVLKVYEDDSYGFPFALIFGTVSEADTVEMAKILAKGLPVEVDKDFYIKYRR